MQLILHGANRTSVTSNVLTLLGRKPTNQPFYSAQMEDYPNPEEEFDLEYNDELELLREQDFQEEDVKIEAHPPARKSLNFDNLSKKDDANASSSQSTNNKAGSSFTSGVNFLDTSADESTFPITDTTLDPSSESRREYAVDNSQLSTISSNRKRAIEELCGDVNDILDDIDLNLLHLPTINHRSKKPKLTDKEAQDLEIIDLILKKREEYKLTHSLKSATNNRKNSQSEQDRNKRNISNREPKYPSVKVHTFDDEPIYIRFHSEKYEEDELRRIINQNSYAGLIGDSFDNIWKDAKELLKKRTHVNVDSTAENLDSNLIQQHEEIKQLWVDLYKPKKYLELLSDESTNRTLLKWMKLWDKIVFNVMPTIKVKAPSSDTTATKNKFFSNQLNTNLDEYGRPEHKVVLLCGPPGLGKTTLAHMVAKHSGYNVVELNASDDRSIEMFKKTLENATQNQSVIDHEGRPNCIVLDEVDGAPQASIDFLVRFISNAGVATAKNNKKAVSKKKGKFILKRPIICICNDLYVPALRSLRQISFIIHFPLTSTTRLSERLMEICRKQQIKTDSGAMLALAEKSNNDIRSCLSVLHFFKDHNRSIGLLDVNKTSVGQKDLQQGLFAVWQEIFQISKKLSKPKIINERVCHILNMINSFGDHERVAQGIYENYPNLNVKGLTLENIVHAMNWFCFNDFINSQVNKSQNYSLNSYLDYAFVIWHFVFGRYSKQKLKYPTLYYEAKVKENRRKSIITELLRGVSPSIRIYLSTMSLILDLLPLLVKIITPPPKTVSLQFYSDAERKKVLQIVGIMVDYNLNYIPERKADRTYEYTLEPNIEEVALFEQSDAKIRIISYINKQLIAKEIELEKIQRLEARAAKKATENNRQCGTGGQSSRQSQATCSTALPNYLQTLKSKINSQSHVETVKLLEMLLNHTITQHDCGHY